EVAHGAEGVDLAAADGGGAARPGGVADAVVAGVLVRPERLAAAGVEAEDALAALQLVAPAGVRRAVAGGDVIGDEDAAAGDRRPGEAAVDLRAPQHLGAARRELAQQALLAPDVVPVRPHPLRPVVAARAGQGE